MCVIAVSRKGVRQPTLAQLKTMFKHNPDGAGYMFARNGKVYIHKGFMDIKDFINAVKAERFTAADPVVYHFRIATQAGVNPQMTHPFPLTADKTLCEKLDLTAPVGVTHNGVIQLTSDLKEKRYSDTAIFITEYLVKLLRKKSDLKDLAISIMISELTNHSKWAIMEGTTGEIVTIGPFITDKGLMFSNNSYQDSWQRPIPYSFGDIYRM